MKLYKIPTSAEECTSELVADLKNIGLVPNITAVWKTGQEWFDAIFWGPILTIPSDKKKDNKCWGFRNGFLNSYLRFAKNADGTWMKWKVVASGKPTGSGETFKQPEETNPNAPMNMMALLGQNAQALFAEYGTKINAIPQLEAIIAPEGPYDAYSVNYGSTGFTQLPINVHWPAGFIPIFDEKGEPCIVKIEDYIANTPKPSTPGVGKYTEAQIGAFLRANIEFLDNSALGKYAKSLVLA